MRGVLISNCGLQVDNKASIGIGSLIIFIAMILVAGIATTVIFQTMNNLQQRALQTSEETLEEISSGLRVTHVSGYMNGSKITQVAIFLTLSAGSDAADLSYVYISISDTNKKVVLAYNSSCFSNSVSNGLFGTLNSSNLTATEFGVIMVRDIDNSCSASSPIVNEDDLVVLLINTSKCFSGIDTRTEISGNIVPERGISGVIRFTTPSAYVDTIIDLQI